MFANFQLKRFSSVPKHSPVQNGNAKINFLFQSAESKDLQKPNKLKIKSSESLAETPSEDDFDSAFTENCENGKKISSETSLNSFSYFQFTSLF